MTNAETITRRAALAAFALILGMLLSLGAASAAASGELAPSPFGGHVHALAIHPESGDLFLGARPVYRSADGGKTWSGVRSEERGGGKECVGTGGSGWSP